VVDVATTRESREGFRQLVNDNFDEPQRTRVWQLLEAVVFSEQPILRGLERFEVRFGDGAPTSGLYPTDGLGVYIDEAADEAYVVLQWQGSFLFIGGSGAGSVPGHTHVEAEITDLDHLTESEISHLNINDIGSNTHAQVDTHIADGSIHFTLPVIDYAYVSGIDAGTDVTAGELEELSDGSDTALHIHDLYTPRSEWLQNGFPDAADAEISWDDATRTLTLTKAVTSFSYYIDGILYTETGSLTEQILDEEGLWVLYLDSEGSITSVKNPTESQIDTVIEDFAIIAYVYWDASNSDGRLMWEMHGSRMSPATHHWIHDNIGAVYKEGMALDDFVISDGADDEDAQFSVASGEFYDEDVEHEPAAILKTTGLEIWYLDTTSWRWTTEAGFSILTAGSGRMAYNDAGAQTEIGNNRYGLTHVFATNITADDGTGPKYIAIQGQAEYLTKTAARTGAETEINDLVYGTFPLQEVIPVATVIFQTGGYGNAVKSKVVTTDSGDNWVDWRTSNLKAAGGSISDHGSLAGLADDDHGQYLLASDATDRSTFATNWTDLTDAGLTALHSHAAGSVSFAVDTQTAATLTLTSSHDTVLCDASGNGIVITLPTAVGIEGKIYWIKCIDDTNTVELAPDGAEEIEGSNSNVSLTLMDVVAVQSDNANWWMI